MAEDRDIRFSVRYKNGSRIFHLGVERTWKTEYVEEYKVCPPHNPDRYILIQNNRPYLREKLRLKHKRIVWQVVHGTVNNVTALNDVLALIEAKLES